MYVLQNKNVWDLLCSYGSAYFFFILYVTYPIDSQED